MMQKILTPLFSLIISTSLYAEVLMKPTTVSKDLYPNKILEGSYLSNISKPNKFLGFELGERVATPAQISSAILEWSKLSDRLKVVEYARSHEGRPLFSIFISSPANINNLDVIKVADYIVDLGPEGGKRGGYILVQGTPEKVAKYKKSSTARYLKEELE